MARLTWAKQYLYGSHLNYYFNKNLCVFVCLQQVCNMSREYLPSSLLPDNKSLDMVHPITITSSVGAVGYLLACIRQAGQLAIWQARIFEIYQNLEKLCFCVRLPNQLHLCLPLSFFKLLAPKVYPTFCFQNTLPYLQVDVLVSLFNQAWKQINVET